MSNSLKNAHIYSGMVSVSNIDPFYAIARIPDAEKLADVIHLLPTKIIKWMILNLDRHSFYMYHGSSISETQEMYNKTLAVTEDSKKALVKEFILRGLI